MLALRQLNWGVRGRVNTISGKIKCNKPLSNNNLKPTEGIGDNMILLSS